MTNTIDKLKSYARGGLIVLAGLGIRGCADNSNKTETYIPKWNEVNPGYNLVFVGETSREEFDKAKHVVDITGDGIGDTYQVQDNGDFVVWAGRMENPHGTSEPTSYGGFGRFGTVKPEAITTPRARLNEKGELETLIRYHDRVDVYRIERKEATSLNDK